MAKSLNKNLTTAKKEKNDEFYTQLTDIEKEMKHYKNHFKDKVVLCNCDDPRESKFFHYFSYNFEALGLKKLIAICYKKTEPESAIWLEYNGDKNGDRIPNTEEIGIHELKGDGDFRSEESIELLKEADIIITNPPFSLFREFVALMMTYDKKFLIIGSQNAITYKECFKHIKDNNMWLGVTSPKVFLQPDNTTKTFGNICWFTNLPHNKRNEDLIIYKKYAPEEYPVYDNYDAINVDKTKDIPLDFKGAMGVPITFLDKYNPEQFDILGITKTWFGGASKIYPTQIQVGADGKRSIVSKLNDGATLKLDIPPHSKTYYIVDNDYFVQLYARIIIKNKKL